MILKKGGKLLGILILFVLTAAFVILISLLIVKPGTKDAPAAAAVQADFPDPVSPLSTGNAQALARAFSHPLPALPSQSFQGEIRSVPFEGKNALMVTLQYPAFTLTCVQPALAAPLLLKEGLTPTSVRIDNTDGFSVLSMPAIYLKSDTAHCFYFSDESAAYALYTDQTDLSTLVYFASALRWVN